MKTLVYSCALVLLVSAQSTVSPTDRYAYSANAGWIDFRPSAADGVVFTESYLSGYAYAANFGWIHLGDGSPANGFYYVNNSATDYGVNLNVDGTLAGYAYAANIGWIKFEQVYGQPKLDYLTGQLSGYAYSANVGWISLDTSTSNLLTTLACPDTDGDGIGDAYEMAYFEQLGKIDATTDYDGDCISDVQEYNAGTDPTDASSNLRITDYSFDFSVLKVNLSFTSVQNRIYSIEQDTDLQGVWADSGLGNFSPDGGSITNSSYNYPAGPRQFFRVVAKKPLQ